MNNLSFTKTFYETNNTFTKYGVSLLRGTNTTFEFKMCINRLLRVYKHYLNKILQILEVA